MTGAVAGDDGSARHAGELDSSVAALARRWARAVAGTSYVPMDQSETVTYLSALLHRLAAAAEASPPDTGAAAAVGASLVDAHFTSPATLARTIAELPSLLGELSTAPKPPVVSQLQGSVAAGYAGRLQERTLAEQDAIRRAGLATRHEAENAARASEARFRAVFAGAAIGIAIADMRGDIVQANPALAAMLGTTPAGLRRRNVSSFMHPEDSELVATMHQQLVRGERDNFGTTKRFLRADGRGIWTHLTVSLIRDDQGQPEFEVAVIEDVTDVHRLQSQLHWQAYHDTLTGLANRAALQSRLDDLFNRPDGGKRVGLCLLDLDGFKAINDSLGHVVGDQLLTAVATRIEEAVAEKGHLVARLGGDEFVVLVADTSGASDVIAVADAVFDALQAPIVIPDGEYSASVSAGLVERPISDGDPADLIRAADITLYWAKAEGKNRWALFDHARSEREVAAYTLTRTLPAALDNGELRLDYQPLVELRTGRAQGVEALLRWEHPTLGRLGPETFIGAVENSEFIVALGLWVLRAACEQARDWTDRLVTAPFVSVNVTVRQCRDPDFAASVAAILADTGVAASQLQIELTERAVIGTDEQPIAVLRSLADMGVRIAIDDFGTGYSNMTYLRRLPVHALKLDASFIEGLHGDQVVTAEDEIVASVVALSHTLGLTVTAEGVHTCAQADRLRAIGCDYGQGTYFGSPCSADEAGRVLERSRAEDE